MLPHENFYEHIRASLLSRQEQIVVVWPAGKEKNATSASYAGQDILNRVQGIREVLVSSGVKPAERVLLIMPVGMDIICSLLALMALGAVPVLPPAGISSIGLLRLLRRSSFKIVVTQQAPGLAYRLVGRLFGIRIITIGREAARASSMPSELINQEQPALISHSSGSTGVPKAIRRGHRVLLAQHHAIKTIFPPWVGQRDLG